MNVLNVAKYIIKHYHKNDLTTTKLEELLYYSQVWSLAFRKKPLFSNEIQAWINGPVCPDILNLKHHQFSINWNLLNNFKYNENMFTNNQKIIMNNVIKYYGKHSSWYLSRLSQKETPWILARNGVPIDKPSKNIISNKTMMNYYSRMIVNPE